MEFETILTEERDGVFIITFNRLEARNAINNLMTKELSDALDYALACSPITGTFSVQALT